MMARVLIACEYSGTMRDAFIAAGHEALSCDLLPTDYPGPHYQGDIRALLIPGAWDLMVAHPPCTFLCSSGLHWNKRRPERAQMTEDALEFVRLLLAAPVPHIALENPIGCIGTRIRPADQVIQPWQFGDDASKATAFWLVGLPLLEHSGPIVPGRRVTLPSGRVVERWANQTDSGQNRLPPSADRWKLRSETYPGIAKACARQWGSYVEKSSVRR